MPLTGYDPLPRLVPFGWLEIARCPRRPLRCCLVISEEPPTDTMSPHLQASQKTRHQPRTLWNGPQLHLWSKINSTSHTNITSVWYCNRNPDSSGSSNHSSSNHSSSSSANRRPILWLPTCHTPLQITDVTRWLHHSKRNYLHLESEFAAWSLTENLHVIRSTRTFHQDDIKLQFVDMSHQPNVTFLHSQFSSPYVGNFSWHTQGANTKVDT